METDLNTHLARARTGLAEDRTMLANERTFSSWIRTGMASIGVGLGFNALFHALAPNWLPRLIATAFLALAILIFITAERAACSVARRLHAHHVQPVRASRLRFIAVIAIGVTGSLMGALWLGYLQ